MSSQEKNCSEEDIALKSFFLGPQAENAPWFSYVVAEMLNSWFFWRMSCYPKDGRSIAVTDHVHPQFKKRQQGIVDLLRSVSSAFEAEIPKFSPRYVGHMFSEISMPALLGHFVTLLHNPNNISEESSKVGSKFEEDAVALLSEMVGMPGSIGHFTSGGTVANFEAYLRARMRMYMWLTLSLEIRNQGGSKHSYFESCHLGWQQFEDSVGKLGLSRDEFQKRNLLNQNPFDVSVRLQEAYGRPFRGPVLLVPKHRHYSWQKTAHHFGLGEEGLWPVQLRKDGTMDTCDLKLTIDKARSVDRPIVAVISVAGTTEFGNIDAISEIESLLLQLRVKENIHIWHHVDAAYGGFFCSLLRGSQHPNQSKVVSEDLRRNLESICTANSVTLDPHKLGYVPYSCGALLVRDSREYSCFDVDAPYIAFDETKKVGKQTLEGSRSAAGAVATWMTGKSIGFHAEGYGRILSRTILQKREFESRLVGATNKVIVIEETQTNVCCFFVADRGDAVSKINKETLALFHKLSKREENGFFVSKTLLQCSDHISMLGSYFDKLGLVVDAKEIQLLRLCLMNPFFSSKETSLDFTEELVKLIVECVHG